MYGKEDFSKRRQEQFFINISIASWRPNFKHLEESILAKEPLETIKPSRFQIKRFPQTLVEGINYMYPMLS